MSQKREPPRCYECKQIITFDDQHIGKNGKKIPLDPATKQPHDCPMREKVPPMHELAKPPQYHEEEKDDHGNEQVFPSKGLIDTSLSGTYVDHTAKGQSKVVIFSSDMIIDLEGDYNKFLTDNNGKIRTQGAQFQLDNGVFAIALYYEEVK